VAVHDVDPKKDRGPRIFHPLGGGWPFHGTACSSVALTQRFGWARKKAMLSRAALRTHDVGESQSTTCWIHTRRRHMPCFNLLLLRSTDTGWQQAHPWQGMTTYHAGVSCTPEWRHRTIALRTARRQAVIWLHSTDHRSHHSAGGHSRSGPVHKTTRKSQSAAVLAGETEQAKLKLADELAPQPAQNSRHCTTAHARRVSRRQCDHASRRAALRWGWYLHVLAGLLRIAQHAQARPRSRRIHTHATPCVCTHCLSSCTALPPHATDDVYGCGWR
jgi:hypothetical protein